MHSGGEWVRLCGACTAAVLPVGGKMSPSPYGGDPVNYGIDMAYDASDGTSAVTNWDSSPWMQVRCGPGVHQRNPLSLLI